LNLWEPARQGADSGDTKLQLDSSLKQPATPGGLEVLEEIK